MRKNVGGTEWYLRLFVSLTLLLAAYWGQNAGYNWWWAALFLGLVETATVATRY
ncbi:MAG: DUF2892 domain-containing protein [Clostridia bacterium]|nr:DUF2892 domain-containing protein [Clostridia bacterium]